MKGEAHEGTDIVTQTTRGTWDAIRGGEPEGCCESSFYHLSVGEGTTRRVREWGASRKWSD